jgi:hypothetical protein
MELLPLEMVKLELLKDMSHYKLMLSEELLNKKFKLKLVIQTIFLKNKLLENHELITEIDLEEKIIKKEEKEDLEENKVIEDLEEKIIKKVEKEDKIEDNKVIEDQEEKIIKKEEDKIVDNKEKEDLEDKMVIEDHLDNTKIDPKEKVKMIDQKCNGLKLVLLNPDKKGLTF